MDVAHRSDAIYLQVRERLDIAKVEMIEAWLGQTDPEQRIVLDFHETRAFDVAALTRLARVLSQTNRPVALRGLSENQYRLLRYVDVPQQGETGSAVRLNCRP